MCKFTLYFRCKRPSVSLVIFLSISGPTTTAYHCLEMINCSDNTWGFCIPFPFSRLQLCSFSTAGRFCRHYEKHSCVRLGMGTYACYMISLTCVPYANDVCKFCSIFYSPFVVICTGPGPLPGFHFGH